MPLLLGVFLQYTGLSSFIIIRTLGYRIRFHPKSSLALAVWLGPRKHDKSLSEFVRAGDTVVDVGANIGTVSIPMAQTVGNQGRVIAIEPHPLSFRYLQENVQLNHHEEVVSAINCALGAEHGQVYFSDHSSTGPI